MKTIELKYQGYCMTLRFGERNKDILVFPTLKVYYKNGIQYFPPSYETPISGTNLKIHHEFISAN